jgi:thiamine kinase-like enzyme
VPEDLDPELRRIVDEVWDPGVEISATPITSGITNRNYRVDIGAESFVVRIPGMDTELLGIDRRAELEAAQAAAEAGVAPAVFAFLPDRSCLITRFVEGVPVSTEDLERPHVLDAVVRSIRAIHEMPGLRSTFDPWEVIADHRRVAAERGVDVPPEFVDLFGHLEDIAAAFDAAEIAPAPCHNDLLNANLIRAGQRIVIVDYEYAGMDNVFFDLGNFSINNGISEGACARLLAAYFGEVGPWHEACLALMRIMSDFREAMWGVAQQTLSTLEFDYDDYARRHFQRLRSSIADRRYTDWLLSAAGG